MQRTLLVVLFLSVSLLLTGCGKEQATSTSSPNMQTAKSPGTNAANKNADPSAQQASQNVLENIAPKTTNDLPTTIDETQKDLQVVEQDLQEIEQMDLTEETIEL